MKKFLEEFKTFILRGNIIDMAVGVIIGGAFTGLVSSLLDNILSPIIGCFNVGGFNNLHFKIWKADVHFGAFIGDVVNFVIMAFVVFMILKFVNTIMDAAKKKEEAKPAEPPKPSNEELLLIEIRDLLKEKKD